MILEREERGGGRDRERIDGRETLLGCLPYAPDQGMNLHLGSNLQPFGVQDFAPTS